MTPVSGSASQVLLNQSPRDLNAAPLKHVCRVNSVVEQMNETITFESLNLMAQDCVSG
jgi:hypothetical protein